ncbi:MAG: sulfotransferase, partial [Acidobacteriota bacterium]
MQAIDRARAPRSPLYLASTPRSGATLLAAMLNRHRHIAMFNEPWFFQLAAKYGSLRRRPNVRRLLNDLSYSGRGFGAAIEDDWLSEIEAEILAAGDDRPLAGFLHFLDRFAALQGKPRWGVKQPHGILDAPHLLRQRPD